LITIILPRIIGHGKLKDPGTAIPQLERLAAAWKDGSGHFFRFYGGSVVADPDACCPPAYRPAGDAGLDGRYAVQSTRCFKEKASGAFS